VDEKPRITTDATVGGFPIKIPVLDIFTIGAGGGSIAFIDKGGLLRVGPISAGANPGPASYGIGLDPTVTDANLILGRLRSEYFLGGRMQLDTQRALQAYENLGRQIGLNPIETALGVIEITNSHMERALRLISVERGIDPTGNTAEAEFTLLSFGGAGGLHATNLAHRLGIRRILIPSLASTLSAYGMLAADIVKDRNEAREYFLLGD
jgi:N-methylhydantoinase A